MKKSNFIPWRRTENGVKMTLIQIIDTFTFYGADVILLAWLTNVTVYLLKISVLKKMQKKLLTFVPFITGTVLYAAYAAVRNLSFTYIFANYTQILEHGLSVGAVSTLLYVIYEQFVRQDKSLTAREGVIKALIAGFVPTDKQERTAKLIAEAVAKDVTGSGAERAAEILFNNSGEDVSEKEIALLSKLIIEALSGLHE